MKTHSSFAKLVEMDTQRKLHIDLWRANPLAFWLMPSREEMLDLIHPHLQRTDRVGELTRRNAKVLTASMEGYSLELIVQHNAVLAAWWNAICGSEQDAVEMELKRLGL